MTAVTLPVDVADQLDAIFAELPRLLSVDEVADLLRVSASALYMWRSAGLNGGDDPGPRSFKIGSRVAYLRTEVRNYLERQLAETSSKQ